MSRADRTDGLLAALRDEIAARAAAISGAVPEWPCRKGCDRCCQNLACLPELVEQEWADVEEGLTRLEAGARAAVESRLSELLNGACPPYVCPFLDRENGACYIYPQRPVACRTYGFYVQRGVGSYCGLIRERAENGEYAAVVWGNHEAIDVEIDRMGRRIAMLEWLQRRQAMR
jgi:Fe-S-cluster containining protein